MHSFILISFLFLGSVSHAIGEKSEEKRDFSIICAVSKAAQALDRDKYLNGEADRVALVWGMIENSIKTQEVKNVIKAISSASPKEKVKLMKQAANDVGLKNWKCSTLEFLL